MRGWGLGLAAALALATCGGDAGGVTRGGSTSRVGPIVQPTVPERTGQGPIVPRSSAPRPIAAPEPLPDGDDTTVEYVVDGDTIVVAGGERVRFIGIDTPETKDPRKPVQCFGAEAARRTGELLAPGTGVRLAYDVERLDRYDRTLAYVYRLDDGLFVNAKLVRDGYAFAYTYPPNVAHADEFVALQRQAREANRGLWAACPAGPDTPATTAAGSAAPTVAPGAGCDPAYPDGCIPSPPPDLDCADVSYRRFRVLPPDPHGFDSDGDGMGCESG